MGRARVICSGRRTPKAVPYAYYVNTFEGFCVLVTKHRTHGREVALKGVAWRSDGCGRHAHTICTIFGGDRTAYGIAATLCAPCGFSGTTGHSPASATRAKPRYTRYCVLGLDSGKPRRFLANKDGGEALELAYSPAPFGTCLQCP